LLNKGKYILFGQLLTTLRRVRTSLIAVPALQFGGALRLVAHRGVRNKYKIKQDSIFSQVQLIPVELKEEV